MQNRFDKGSIAMCAMAVMLGFSAQARSFEFRQFKSTGSKANSEYYWMGTEKSKSAWYRVKIGGASKIDDTSEMEIRAATVFKNVKDRKTGVNDIAKFKFDPINRGKAIYFMVSSGVALSLERDKYWYGNDGRADRGWQLAGCIIEIWQKGKVVKHWSGAGNAGKVRLADGIPLLRINKDGYASEGDRNRFDRDFDNATKIFSVDAKGERVDIDDVLQPYRESEDDSEAESEKKSAKKDDSADEAPVKNVVAQKLRQCDFLLNEKFKKKAKFYLCLFSASWCPPCRAEMPRIAETYADTLKNDPDIELIHFSRDQDEEKAMAWAKEHDVKFPVVKPNGGNPLDLHSRGIPHLFIVKADGTLVEEGHPMRLFTEEKLRELKEGNFEVCAKSQSGRTAANAVVGEQKETVAGYTWSYSVRNGEATIVSPTGKSGECAVSPKPTGDVTIPSTLGGVKVTSIGNSAFAYCREMTSVTIPSSVTSIGFWAFYQCWHLTSVIIPEGVTSIGTLAFEDCWSGLTSVTIPSTVTKFGWCAFAGNSGKMTAIGVSPANPKYTSVNGLLCSKDGKTVIAGVNGDVKIPDGVISIGDGAFRKYRGLTSVAIPSSVVSIDDRAFTWCDRLESFSVSPESSTFASPDGLLCSKDGKTLISGVNGDVVIPDGVTKIVESAFSGRNMLKSVTIPSSVMKIGKEAFRCCRGLISVKMRGERPESDKDVFCYCEKLKSIHVPANAKSWAGMKEWQGIPLVFDAEATK